MNMSYKGAVAGISLIVAGLLGATAHAADKIAFIAANMANESQAFSSKQFQKFGKDYGFEVVVLDAKGDTQTESQLVTNSIAQKFKAIFLNPNDINAIVPSVMKAKQAGVVVGMFSSDLAPANQKFRDFFVGVNDTMAGEAAGDAFLKHFPNGATIVEVGGQAGHDAQIKREAIWAGPVLRPAATSAIGSTGSIRVARSSPAPSASVIWKTPSPNRARSPATTSPTAMPTAPLAACAWPASRATGSPWAIPTGCWATT